MKFIFTFSLLATTLFCNAQVPMDQLWFAHTFSNSYTATIPENFESYSNTVALGPDVLGNAENAAMVNAGQNILFDNLILQAGSGDGNLSVSVKFKADLAFLETMTSTYSTVFMNGDCFIRIIKAGSYFIQVGLFNDNDSPDTFGYINTSYLINPSLIGEWTSVTMTYDGNPTEQILKLYVNGEFISSANHTYTCGQGGNVVYLSGTLTLGGMYGFDDSPYQGLIDEVYIHNRTLTDEEVIAVHSSTSLVDVAHLEEQLSQISIYPNPATDNIAFDLASNELVQIVDLNGRIVRSEMGYIGKNSLFIQDLPAGIYHLQSTTVHSRFIKL
jgi:hypothetical protein